MEALARRNFQEMLNAVASKGAGVVAEACKRDEATVAKWKASEPGKPGPWETFAIAMAALGLKLVPEDFTTVDPEEYEALLMLLTKRLERARRTSTLGKSFMYTDE